MLSILITTRSRVDNQKTLLALPKLLLRRTFLVVDADEHEDYIDRWEDVIPEERILSFPGGILSEKRHWCVYNAPTRYISMLDDDMGFLTRHTVDGKQKMLDAKASEIIARFNLFEKWLREEVVHCGESPRRGNNWVEEEIAENTRMTGVLCYDTKFLVENKLKFNRLPLQSDFDMTLQLLEMGQPNRVSYKYIHSHFRTKEIGGCALYRTKEMMHENSLALKALHPMSVTVVEGKKIKDKWAGMEDDTRTDVKCHWKKAIDHGVRKIKTSGGIKNFLRKK